MDDPIKTISTNIVYQNPWITVREDQVIHPSGVDGIYGYIESKPSVMVVVQANDAKVLLLKAFRYPTKTWGWELPGGGGDGEDLIVASKRELQEETGIVAKTWTKLSETLVCNGLMTERMATCLATDIRISKTEPNADEVFADQKFFTWSEIDTMIANGEINDGQTITGLYLARLHLTKGVSA